MWLTLCGALILLLAFGPKVGFHGRPGGIRTALTALVVFQVVSLFIRLVLLAVHKLGLFSNVRIDECCTLQLTVHAVHIHVWRNLWAFVRSPTHHALVTVEVAAAHVIVILRDVPIKQADVQGDQLPRGSDYGSMWGELDTSTSLKHLDHPHWKQVCTWMHRVPFMCFLLPIVNISLRNVEVDVVRDDSIRASSIVRLQRGNLTVQVVYKRSEGDIDVSAAVCPREAAIITLPSIGVEATLRNLQVNVSIPISRGREDARAPLPSSLRVQCDGLGCSVDMIALVKASRQDGNRDTSRSQLGVSPETEPVTHADSVLNRAVRSTRGLLVLRYVELVPEVIVKICNIETSVVNGANKVGGRINAIECKLQDIAKIGGVRRQQRQDAEGMTEERKLVVNVSHLHLCSELRTATDSPPPSSITIEALKVEVETALTMASSSTAHNGSEHLHTGVLLLWNLRCTGDAQGLSITLTADLAPWVESLHSFASPAKSNSPAMFCCQDAEGEVEGKNAFWNGIIVVEMQIQFKLFRTDVLCQARKHRCSVLPNGVPDIGLSLDEVVLFAHPFTDEEPLGVRARADLQASRLKVFYSQGGRSARTSFLSIDFVRVLIEPICVLGSNSTPADVDMEAEWLEARWTAEAMHAIGGLLELGIVTFAPLLRERFDWTSDEYWDPMAPEHVSSMRPMRHIVEDHTLPSEALKFRCKVKRSLVLFSHSHSGHSYVDYVTVDTLNMSVEETTGRFRLSVLDTKVCSCEGVSESGASFRDPLIQQQHNVMRRRPSTLATRSDQQTRRGKAGHRTQAQGSAFFSVKAFALEENKLPLCPMKVLDMFVDGVACTWDMRTQERVVELIRRITFSAWEMLYRMRSAYGVHCTSSNSRYNREGGLNGVINDESECDDGERLLSKLISAGGDALNRIHATNIDLQATFGGHALELHVGVFASEDLPELWLFEYVAITLGGSLKLLEMERVQVRHTVHKRRDYVFGFFEEALRQRQLACGRLAKNTSRSDGMMIDIVGLRVGLSLQVDLNELANAIQAAISPFVASHMKSFLAPWRPQEEIFYGFFFRVPNTRGQPRVWLQLNNIQVECIDRPMETWLEHVYPLWMEELAEQELRSQLLNEQVAALKQTNAEMLLSDESTDELKARLDEKSSKIFVHKVRRLQDNLLRSRGQPGSTLHSGTIVTVHIGSVAVDVFSDANERAVTERIRTLDEASLAIDQVLRSAGLNEKAYEPNYSLLLHQQLDVCVLDTCVRMRNFPTPVAVIEKVDVHGHTIIAAIRSPDNESEGGLFALTAAFRCFMDLSIAIQRPVVFFGPAYLHTMLELAAIVDRVLPSLVLDVDRIHETTPWDIARRLIHGKLHLEVENAALRLLASPTTFRAGDYLEVGIQSINVKCRRGEDAAADCTIDRITVRIEPDALVNIAEITSLTLHSKATWSASRDASIHYILPIEYCKADGSDAIVMDYQEGGIWRRDESAVDLASRLRGYSATGISVSISGKIAPKSPAEQMTRREIASRSAIVLYTKHVEWLIPFGRAYQTLTQVKYPSRRHRAVRPPQHQESRTMMDSTMDRFLGIFEGVTVEEFAFIGLDVALYHSEKSQVGLRACINDKIAFSGAVKAMEEAAAKPPPLAVLRQLRVEWNGYSFAVDDVSLAVSDVQVRICTPSTGSRGESLISIRDVCLNISGGRRIDKHTHESFDFVALHSELTNSTTTIEAAESSNSRFSTFKLSSTPSPITVDMLTEASRTKSKINILEHFAIAQHNPFRYRDDTDDGADFEAEGKKKPQIVEAPARTGSRSNIQSAFVDDFRRQGFLLGLTASEIRVLVTLDTVETLVDIGESWVRVIRAGLPELERVPDEILQPQPGHDPNAAHSVGMDSPKKATSLADDPKFGPIFHASNPMPNNRTPSFNVDVLFADAALPAPQSPTSGGAGVVEPFLIVRFMDCQINFQDHQNKGSVLLALSRGTVRYSRSEDVLHELVDVKVDGVQLFTAPLDIDVRSRVIWLRAMDDGFTYCPSSFGLLKQVVAPIPAKVIVWIDRDIAVLHRVDLSIPTVEIGVHIDSKNILENLVVALTSVITTKFAEYQAPDYSKMLQGFRGARIQSSLQQLMLTKKHLTWEMAALDWRNACRWNYQVTERASLAMHAMEGLRSHGGVELDAILSPFLHARRLSSASLSSSIGMTSLTLTESTTTHVESVSDERQRLQQQHASLSEVLRSLVAAEQLKRQPNPNVQLTFKLQNASLTLSATNSDIVSAAMTNLVVKLKMHDDQSGTFALTLQDVCCRNLCPNTPYPELLVPLRNSRSWSGDEMFVRIDAEVAPPVGRVKIVRHFEINVHPMQVCLSYDLILQLVAFFASVSGPSSRQEEKKAEMRSQFLAVPHGSTSGEGLLRKAVKVAGKAAHPLTHGLGRHRADSDQDQPIDPRVKAMHTLQEEAAQWISRVARAEAAVSTAGTDEDDAAIPTDSTEKDPNDMRGRTNTNILFKRIRLGTVEVMVSFKNKKSTASSTTQPALEDMRGFEVKIHSLVYSDKTCSLMDLLLRIQRDVILDVLSQVGRNFTNVATFLRDQLDITRWGTFDALAPLKSLSTAIAGGSHSSSLTAPASPANAPTSPSVLSVEMLQRSPRVSHDASPSVAPSSSPSTPVDTSKVFQLELPENHPSRRKKQPSQSRPCEPVGKCGDASAVPVSPLAADKDDSDTPSSTGSSAGGTKTKISLSSFFGKSKKAMQPTASIAENEELQ